ncbi:hypothetical protein SMRA8_1407 [Stenotrophomonas maltophilia RA8]|uniref:DUF937 domain-containing protein n=1 Tax=Stenotrophomonas TaxID=40323 RepID=UPI0002C528DB|nr:DUF937 domain-containing protein [Stenotrophomonas maltophilia]PJL06430.1 calcium-binding protein [Stenotrophomonas maltophilia]QGL75272.1 DUF937 domain-containing protein [Stenotrophomonas maltophilia]CCP15432.1 hypothetical protein SMRA8_1407 [Stenotrophomonas maltophilia RA8]
MSLTDELLAKLQGAPLQQVSQQLGISDTQASGAISAALPVLMGALGNNASQPQGAQALLGALQNNHSGLDLGGVLGSVLGGGGASGGAASDGAGILGHIFGGSQQKVETGLAQATQLDSGRTSQLLQILAPIVMAFLAQRLGGGQADAGSLSQALGQEKQQVQQQGGLAGGLLGSLLDQDGDGQLGVGDLLKLGGNLLGGKR